MLHAPNLAFDWLVHGFGGRDSVYPDRLTTVKQIHSDIVLDAEGREGIRGEGDALISNLPGVTVAVKTADCVPILIVDRATRAVAAVHAGWRGTAAQIVKNTVLQMVSLFDSRPEDMCAAIGPAIGGCCYEVSADVAHRFETWAPELEDVQESTCVNLVRVNRIQLIEMGVPDIWTADVCTKCESDRYWSFRRDKEQAGRQMSYIGQR